jgi:glycosyltransferase involved in cell wall biosynthesis
VVTVNVRPPLREDQKPLSFYCSVNNVATGYGRLCAAFLEAMELSRVGLNMRPDIVLDIPGSTAFEKVRFTMWEASQLPGDYNGFMRSRALIVPCSHNVGVFRDAGYKNPIHVVPLWGEARFSPLPESGPFRFICVARENGVPQRKGMPQLVRCFKKAFQGVSDVRLTLKRSPTCSQFDPEDKRIDVLTSDMSKDEYESLLSSHHCGVFLSGLEGWNLPACELMAAGRPSILIPYGGPADFTTKSTSWHLDYGMVRVPDVHPYRGVGFGAMATDDSVIESMRDAVNNWSSLMSKANASANASLMYTKDLFKERLRASVFAAIGRC